MAKSKRTAEDIARLFHKECDPLPPSELAKISAWVKIETRKSEQQVWRRIVPIAFCGSFALAPVLGFLVLRSPEPLDIFKLAFFLFGPLVAVPLCFLEDKRALLRGFIRGIQVSNPGAPKKWTMPVCKETVGAVQAVAAETGMSVARSIEILKKRDPERWRSLSEPRYYEAVRQLEKST
jgi:hypothetical protein